MVLSASITRDSSPPDATRLNSAGLVTTFQRHAELHVLAPCSPTCGSRFSETVRCRQGMPRSGNTLSRRERELFRGRLALRGGARSRPGAAAARS